MAEETPVSGKGGKKKLILVVVIIALIGGGVGAFIFLKGKAAPKAPTGTKEVKEEKGVAFKKLDPFIVNLSDEEGGRYAKVEITLAFSDKKVEKELEEKLPMVRDSIITIISMKRYNDLISPAGKEALKREIMAKLNALLTSGQVTEIYYTDFVLQ